MTCIFNDTRRKIKIHKLLISSKVHDQIDHGYFSSYHKKHPYSSLPTQCHCHSVYIIARLFTLRELENYNYNFAPNIFNVQ